MQKAPVYMLFGSEGVLGEAFLSKLGVMATNNRIFHFPHREADITDHNQVNPIMEYVRPSIVLNCAAINDEDLCQDAKQGAFLINSRGPEILAESCKKYGAKLVHFSSSSVFDGTYKNPYTERHATKPINILGQSKVAGEQAIKAMMDDYLIIRPGWVFSYSMPSCVPTWIGQADRGDEIAVLDSQYGSPTYADDLVDCAFDLLFHDARGIFHFANSDAASRQSFADAAISLSKTKASIVGVSQDSQRFFKAPLPQFSVISTKKYRQLVKKDIRNWVDALKNCLFKMHRYKP